MKTIPGQYFNGRVSRCFTAELVVIGDNDAWVRIADDGDERAPPPTRVSSLAVTSRLDGVPRSIRFPGGELFRTDHNDRVDALLADAGFQLKQTWVHRLENHQGAVAFSLLVILAAIGSFLQWGIPAIADHASRLVPESAEVAIGEDVLEQMNDLDLIHPSGQTEDARVALEEYLYSHDDGGDLKLLIRQSDFLGANAFALPGGTIIITDDLITLAESDEEILAVYFHETGHIRQRHLVKQALRSSMLSLLVVTLTGDLAAATDLATVIPTMIYTFSYSREFETEADRYALRRLAEAGVDTSCFADIMRRLSEARDSHQARTVNRYLSTHPAPEERIRMIESFSNE